ncbi:unnamed protein product [Zymoseptoria tritici ST99CH_3D1]|nr:unnamed protein product [Zymoseptoria tritici ST99CH_3D1]
MSLPTTIFAAASILLRLTSADPDRGGPQSGQPSFPSCASDCRPAASDYDSLCSATDTLETFKKCVSDNNCEEGDWTGLYQGLEKWCNLTSSVTSGSPPWPTPWPTNSDWTTRTAGDWQNGPFGPNNHGWGPPAWSTNSDWTRGPWTSWWGKGGADGCPASDWPGWTSDWPDWKSGEAPWTSWTACTATTTGSAVVTVTVTDATGGTGVVESTSLGVRVAQKTGGGDGGGNGGNAVVAEGGAMGRVEVAGAVVLSVFVAIVAVL